MDVHLLHHRRVRRMLRYPLRLLVWRCHGPLCVPFSRRHRADSCHRGLTHDRLHCGGVCVLLLRCGVVHLPGERQVLLAHADPHLHGPHSPGAGGGGVAALRPVHDAPVQHAIARPAQRGAARYPRRHDERCRVVCVDCQLRPPHHREPGGQDTGGHHPDIHCAGRRPAQPARLQRRPRHFSVVSVGGTDVQVDREGRHRLHRGSEWVADPPDPP
mmetsp:Transcript_29593/g.73690  ORF Transcript_29593/g.73690 Transcript_29593/m.73690 type:complete len:215 (-) Transcript_29593:5-649(-)